MLCQLTYTFDVPNSLRSLPATPRVDRRRMLQTTAGALLAPLLTRLSLGAAVPPLRITTVDLRPVRATSRTVWLIVELRSDAGIVGLGEASDAFGFANTTAADAARMRTELAAFAGLVKGRSPFDVEWYRQRGWEAARRGLVPATAFSAVEQAMWDMAARALDVPVHALLGGSVRQTVPVYANVNRAVNPRTPQGFAAAARRAVADGFRAVKAAPFDGFPPAGAPPAAIARALDEGVAAVAAMREAIGPTVALMIDCHSFFTVDQAVDVARRLEPQNLAWYEEPVAPERTDETVAIRQRIRQAMAGGEVLFAISGFTPLIRRRAVDTIMPDVKHCGGLLELTRIAAMAAEEGIMVAPHNPSGPISTAASAHVCAGMKNVNYLELQYGETDWRASVVSPPERFIAGEMPISDRPGFGIALDDSVVRTRSLPL
jgi:galactonate dehydratase